MPAVRTRVIVLLAFAAVSACSSPPPTGPSSTRPDSSVNPGQPAPGSGNPPATPPPPARASAPSITAQPGSQTIDVGSAATLTVRASGDVPLKFQWYAGSSGQTTSPVSGATSDRFKTPALTKTAQYWVRVSNEAGAADSETATIRVEAKSDPPVAAPEITSQPRDRTITSGQKATLSVSAAGTAPLSYRWFTGSSGDISEPIDDARASSYTTPALTATTRYWVRVSNSVGSTDSETATITVAEPEGNSAFEQAVLDLVNGHRAGGATCGGTAYGPAAALGLNTKLRAAARAHSQDMAANDYVSHTSRDGRTFEDRIRDAGYAGSYPLGENVAAGPSSPQSVVSGWMASAGHCRNIMNSDFRAIGVGYAQDASSTYRHYWTLDFGGS